ncbi:hypothetical protein E4U54_005426 [Claviceps lovelessii]|nr:hypothetical protein E4U54_005426 [Claviceps lovelessii]
MMKSDERGCSVNRPWVVVGKVMASSSPHRVREPIESANPRSREAARPRAPRALNRERVLIKRRLDSWSNFLFNGGAHERASVLSPSGGRACNAAGMKCGEVTSLGSDPPGWPAAIQSDHLQLGALPRLGDKKLTRPLHLPPSLSHDFAQPACTRPLASQGPGQTVDRQSGNTVNEASSLVHP